MNQKWIMSEPWIDYEWINNELKWLGINYNLSKNELRINYKWIMNGLQSHEWKFMWTNFIHHVAMFDVNVYDTHPPYFNSSKFTSHSSSSTPYIKSK